MAHTEITVYPKGIECTVLVEGYIATGGSNSYGSGEPAWVEVEDMEVTRTDGTALPTRTAKLIAKEYGDYMAERLIESEW
jgi:hypothetical protein